ncbi:MAG: queuosine precursor transporter [Leptospiraceae bacterium]|nr:queuosine precursor transporter [Leptospiraceae bacterium]
MHHDRKSKLFIWLNAGFLTFLIIAELTGSKLFSFMGFVLTLGVIPFPITFLITDVLNEFYGKAAVKRTTMVGMVMILFVYGLILIGLQIPAEPGSPVDDASFRRVFANSGMVIVGSITAYLVGQFIDIHVFHFLRLKTKGKMVWLRATGSTVVSQLIDSFIVVFIAFGAYKSFGELLAIGANNFTYKMIIAIGLTPLIYLSHSLIEKYLGEEAKHLQDSAMKE